MYIYSILLSGFKSFPQRTIIKFHPGVTAIIGPNGSGKSNIVDAILWAMGEGRSSILRTSIIEDVIFKGSKTRAPLARAEVLINLNDLEDTITIGRRIYKDGESEFLLNGKVMRLREVQDKLWEIGIESREYVVIEQGQVEQLLSMSSEERMVFLESAAGVRKYKERRREALRKIWDIEKELEIVRMKENEMEESYQRTKEQLQRLNNYRKLTKEKEELISTLIAIKRDKIEEGLENLRLERENLRGNLETLRIRKEELLRKLRSFEEKKTSVLGKINSMEEALSELKDRELELKPALIKLREDVATSREKLKSLTLKEEELAKRVVSLEERIKDLESEEKEEKLIYSKLSSQLKDAREKLNEKEEEVEVQRKNYLTILSNLREKETIAQQEREKKNERKKRLEFLREEGERIGNEIRKLEEEKDLTELHNHVEALRKRKHSLENEIAQDKNKATILRDRENQLKKSLRVMEKALKGKGPPKINIKIKKEYADLAELLWEREMRSQTIEKIEGNLPSGFYLLKKEWSREEFSSISGADVKLRDALWRENLEKAMETWNLTGKPVVFPEGVIFPEGVLRIKGEEQGTLSLRIEEEKIKEELERTKWKRKEIEEKIYDDENKLREIEKELQSDEINLESLEKGEKKREENLIKLKERLSSTENERKTLQQEIFFTIAQEEINKISEKTEKARERLKEEEEILKKLREEESNKKTRLAVSNEKIVRAGKERERLEGRVQSSIKENEKLRETEKSVKENLMKLSSELSSAEKEEENLRGRISEFDEGIRELLKDNRNIERKISRTTKEISEIRRKEEETREEINRIDLNIAELKKDLSHLEVESEEKTGKHLKDLKKSLEIKEEQLGEKINEVEAGIEELGEVNFAAEREESGMRKKIEEFKLQRQDLEESVKETKKAASEMDKIYNKKIKDTFEKLKMEFSHLFSNVVKDGESEILITNKGLEIEAKFTGKRKQPLSMLSGGERALLSLIFQISLFRIKPAPFLVLDEVDAPLDLPNLSKLMDLLKELKKDTQIILITHNIKTARGADYIYGVSMPEDGSSRVYYVSSKELFENAR